MKKRMTFLIAVVGTFVAALVQSPGQVREARAQLPPPPCFATPYAMAGPDQSVSSNQQPVTLDGSGSYAGIRYEGLSVPCAGTVVDYQWDFGDGDLGAPGNQIETHRYAMGSYEATLDFVPILPEGNGIGAPDSASITVSPPQPELIVKGYLSYAPGAPYFHGRISFGAQRNLDGSMTGYLSIREIGRGVPQLSIGCWCPDIEVVDFVEVNPNVWRIHYLVNGDDAWLRVKRQTATRGLLEIDIPSLSYARNVVYSGRLRVQRF